VNCWTDLFSAHERKINLSLCFITLFHYLDLLYGVKGVHTKRGTGAHTFSSELAFSPQLEHALLGLRVRRSTSLIFPFLRNSHRRFLWDSSHVHPLSSPIICLLGQGDASNTKCLMPSRWNSCFQKLSGRESHI
jgi:hypothetical protein